MLWVMRRPRVRRLQRASISWVPLASRERARQSYLKQERWARRHGLWMLRLVIQMFLLSLSLTLLFMLGLEAFNQGWIPLPKSSSQVAPTLARLGFF